MYSNFLKQLANPCGELLEEWLIYTSTEKKLYNHLLLSRNFGTVGFKVPSIATESIWMPVTSVDVERNFLNYKHPLNDRRESLTEGNTRRLMILYYNGDIDIDLIFFK